MYLNRIRLISFVKVFAILAVSLLSAIIFGWNVLSVIYGKSGVFGIPSVNKALSFIPSITFGLDISGGSQLLLRADIDKLVEERMTSAMRELKDALWAGRVVHGPIFMSRDNDYSISVSDVSGSKLSRSDILPIVEHLSVEGLVVERDGSNLKIFLSKEALLRLKTSAMEKLVGIVRYRIDGVGTKEALIQTVGGDKILVQVPGVEDPDEIKRLLGKVARLTFHLLHPIEPYTVDQNYYVPSGYISVPSLSHSHWNTIKEDFELGGEHLIDARPTVSDVSTAIAFRLDKYGSTRFATVTENNIGYPLAIVLDGKVVTSPTINSAILTGSGIISGNFTQQEANEISTLLRSGALPTGVTLLEERIIGPSLGAEAIRVASIAGCCGVFLVMLFMILYYRLLGIIASFAIMLNLTLAVSIMALLGITVTLPGVAALILTLGMSVDSNVLIYERIRDEIFNQKSAKHSIGGVASIVKNGFGGAWSGILDSNVTTSISAATMFFFGSSFIKSFAASLITGVICSMFSAIVFTKVLMEFLFVKHGFKLGLKIRR